jgi:hypothetical protein
MREKGKIVFKIDGGIAGGEANPRDAGRLSNLVQYRDFFHLSLHHLTFLSCNKE